MQRAKACVTSRSTRRQSDLSVLCRAGYFAINGLDGCSTRAVSRPDIQVGAKRSDSGVSVNASRSACIWIYTNAASRFHVLLRWLPSQAWIAPFESLSLQLVCLPESHGGTLKVAADDIAGDTCPNESRKAMTRWMAVRLYRLAA